MSTATLLGLIGLGLLFPYGILIVPLWFTFWVLRPYRHTPETPELWYEQYWRRKVET